MVPITTRQVDDETPARFVEAVNGCPGDLILMEGRGFVVRSFKPIA